MFFGVSTALITPFNKGKIDESAFVKFLEWQISEKAHGIVPCGTTGESPTLSHQEHNDVIKLAVDVADKRVKVIAGTGSNSTSEAVDMTKYAESVGADAALLATPYYNKPNQEGLYEHYKVVHDATKIPLIIYNIPGRSVVNMSLETMKELAKLPRVAGVKDATGDLSLPGRVLREIGEDFCQISGEDATALSFNVSGGKGCISVASNVVPGL